MDVLVVGANGLLGSNVVSRCLHRGIDVSGTYHTTEPSFSIELSQLDVRNREQLRRILRRTSPSHVVNCAAMTDVDGCERDPEGAHEINGEAPAMMASLCADEDIHFCHASTDYVFDGDASSSYSESATTGPIQVYGESKLDGERGVLEAAGSTLVTRLSFVYGNHGATGELEGFPAWVRGRLDAGEPTPLFTDQHVTPSRSGQAASTVLDLCSMEAEGLFHVASRSCVTPYEFGREIRSLMDVSPELLEEGTTKDVDRPAARPAYTCLDVSTVEETLGRSQPTLASDLEAIADEFER